MFRKIFLGNPDLRVALGLVRSLLKEILTLEAEEAAQKIFAEEESQPRRRSADNFNGLRGTSEEAAEKPRFRWCLGLKPLSPGRLRPEP